MNKERKIHGLLYETNDFVPKLQENDIQEDFSFQTSGWSPDISNFQLTWQSKVASAVAEVAAFDPRPYGSGAVEAEKKFYCQKSKEWKPVGDENLFPSTVHSPPQELSAFSAAKWEMGRQGVDMRPHVRDKATNRLILLDTGAQVSVFPPDPGDKIDPSMTLKAVNGTRLKCFGKRKVDVKLGRKKYEIEVIKSEVDTPILGWDFVRFHKLDLVWNEWGDVCLYDKKAKISADLEFRALPHTKSQSVAKLRVCGVGDVSGISPEQHSFETFAMQQLAAEKHEDISENDIEKVPEGPFKELLKKYPDVLKLSFKAEHSKNGVLHRIQTGDHPPCTAKVRKLLPGSEKERVCKKAWFELLELGIIERVDKATPNTWTSPVHFPPKPGGGVRPVGDYRMLNKKTLLDQYPLPHLRSFANKIAGSTIFSKVDLRKAFHQIVIDPRDRYKTCVTTPWGLFNFKRLSMGLSNSAQSFQRLVDTVLQDMDNIFCYLDDILLFSSSMSDHLKTMEELLSRLAKAGLTLALPKCEFGQESLDFLGYTVDRNGIRPIQKKIAAIEKYPTPTSQKQVLAFLGCLNYYRASLPNLKSKDGRNKTPAEVLAPLYSLGTCEIPRGTTFKTVWDKNPALNKAFMEAKSLLTNAITLNYPDPNAPLAISCDASKFALGASLDQYVDGAWRPLGLWSKALKPQQQKYTTYRRELMAVQYAMRHFHDQSTEDQ